MLQQLIKLGLLKSQVPSPKSDQWQLSDRKATVLEHQSLLSIALELKPSYETHEESLWVHKATLVLAAFDGGQDSSLQLDNEVWKLWCHYDESLDDKALKKAVAVQLAIAQYLEKGFKKTVEKKPKFEMRMRT
ncbi:hypothetical protein [Parashewanella tropica]|uniref:hypothetical protein n=1 Tax=Parashewanella tropica TaxID=2547970 RepID=UPI00105A69D5|nr:hypothetical protein [Parashewanella tropica]